MPHHVTQRGNRRQATFFCDDDYQACLGGGIFGKRGYELASLLTIRDFGIEPPSM